MENPKEARLIYSITQSYPYGNLFDMTLHRALKLKEGRERIYNPGNKRISQIEVSCYLSIHKGGILEARIEEKPGFQVLDIALKQFIDVAGLPTGIKMGSDWRTCERVLAEYKKKLDPWWYFLPIRDVVDI